MTLSLPTSRHPSTSLASGPASPTLNFGEDLNRFPTESLHSFSFAHQSEDALHNRQSILKRSIDFMRDKLGWTAVNPGIANVQAKLSGNQEVLSMMDLLSRANLIGQEALQAHGFNSHGPLTGPADLTGEDVFARSFLPQSESPTSIYTPAPLGSQVQGSSAATADSRPRSETNQAVDSQSASKAELEAKPKPVAGQAKPSLKRTFTDLVPLSIQDKLTDALAQPYLAGDGIHTSQIISPKVSTASAIPTHSAGPAPHGHGSRWAPAAQAIFTTEIQSPWTITSANDLACLVFGVTKAEVRKIGILEVVRPERRKWLEEKLRDPEQGSSTRSRGSYSLSQRSSPTPTSNLAMGNGVTARLLSKPPSKHVPRSRRAKTADESASGSNGTKVEKGSPNHQQHKSRGVILCGDIVPIQKRNGTVGAASLWVKEKRGGLIWVLEEIAEDVAYVSVDEVGCVVKAIGATEAVWGNERVRRGMDIKRLIPFIPRRRGTNTGVLDYDLIAEMKSFTARTSNSINIPVAVEQLSGESTFRISSLPHIAGIMVLSPSGLKISSSNAVFSAALFGQPNPDGRHINELIPDFDSLLTIMRKDDGLQLVDGIVIPEHSFRRARASLALRDGKADAASIFLRPSGLPAKHRDGAEIMIDVQMRVVKSEKADTYDENVIEEKSEDGNGVSEDEDPASGLVYALWITYSRQLHATNHGTGPVTPLVSRPATPPHQPSPGQSVASLYPEEMDADEPRLEASHLSTLAEQLKEATSESILNSLDGSPKSSLPVTVTEVAPSDSPTRKSIDDFVIIEDMGQGAYGQVKLCRYKKKNNASKVVIKYVTKRRILVDTWTRDRRLGTVPLEIHVLDYLRRDGYRHPNIVEMSDFFEDDTNYYIEMIPHGLPGMDLFDYIELRVNMDEVECRKIFVQVASALHHLHTKAKVVHRDIKDENVVLDGEGNIKLIDFGSAAYIKNGPFDVFVGTIGKACYCMRCGLRPLLTVYLQITQLPRCWRASRIAVKSKMSGHWASCSTQSFTRRIRSTALTRSWTMTYVCRSSSVRRASTSCV